MTIRAPRWERRPDERPDELLEAAIDVFTRRGYRASRLEDVAEAASVTKGTIYYYFESKEDLLRRALRHRLTGGFAPLERELARPGLSAAQRVHAMFARAWAVWTGPGYTRLFQLFTGEVRTDFPELFDEWVREGPVHGCELLTRVLLDGQASGEFRADVDVRTLARLSLYGLLMQAALAEHLDAHDPAPAGAAEMPGRAVELVLDALRPGAGVRPRPTGRGRAAPRGS